MNPIAREHLLLCMKMIIWGERSTLDGLTVINSALFMKLWRAEKILETFS